MSWIIRRLMLARLEPDELVLPALSVPVPPMRAEDFLRHGWFGRCALLLAGVLFTAGFGTIAVLFFAGLVEASEQQVRGLGIGLGAAMATIAAISQAGLRWMVRHCLDARARVAEPEFQPDAASR